MNRIGLFSPSSYLTVRTWLFVTLAAGFLPLPPKPAAAQGILGGVEPTAQYPSQDYYIGLEVYRSGDLEEAVRAFDAARRRTRRDPNGYWIDAIPVLAMQAECYWHVGNMPAVRQHLDEVFSIAIRYRGFLGRMDWESALQPGVRMATPIGLWPEAMAVRRVPVADRIMFQSGSQLSAELIKRGGTIEELNIRSMDMIEILRGLAIASYRRRMLLGPLSEQEPLATQLLDATKYPANLQVPIATNLIGALRATERFAAHDDKQALTDAMKSGSFNGGAHPLSPVTMLVHASVVAGTDKPADAVAIASMAANSAAALKQPEWVGEAMQLAAGCATETQAASVRLFANNAATAMFRKSRLATLHCLVAAADASVTAGDLGSAGTLLSQAQTLSSRRDVFQPRIDAYGAYVMARLKAASGESIGLTTASGVDQALTSMNSFALHRKDRNRAVISMPRIYQLELVRQAVGTSIGGKSSDKLLQLYSDDPPAELWRRDAVDALSSIMLDRSPVHAVRINLAASQGYAGKVLQRGDAMLAARFRNRLPLGGRIAQVRLLASSDEKMLEQEAIDFRAKGPRAMKDLRKAVMAAPPADAKALLAQANTLEAKACEVALSRVHLPASVPPLLNEKLPLGRLPKRTGLLSFIAVGNKLIGTLSVDGKAVMWPVGGASRLPGEIGRLLRGIGAGKTRGARLPEDNSWRKDAVTLRHHLFPDDATFADDRFDDLIIVPDNALWYLPFEMLPIGDEDSSLLGDKFRVRYAATPGLALYPVSMPATNRAVGIASDLFFAPRDLDANEAIIQSIVDGIENSIRLPGTTATPTSLLGGSMGHLLVAAPRTPNVSAAFAMPVAPHDASSPAGSLAGWMRFPAVVPRSVLLAGYRTAADAGQIAAGEEIFFTLCALKTAGVRNILLSRWAVGGESTAIAMRELTQELPITGLSASWIRARAMLRRSELDPTAEPLLTKADHGREGLTGDEPLFWAGYLISSPPPDDIAKPESVQP